MNIIICSSSKALYEFLDQIFWEVEPISKRVKVVVENEGFWLIETVAGYLDVETPQDFKIELPVLNVQRLLALLKNLPDQPITLQFDEDKITVSPVFI